MTRIGDAIHILKVLMGDQVYIRNGCILMYTGGSMEVFDNLVKFDKQEPGIPFSKLLDPCPMQQ